MKYLILLMHGATMKINTTTLLTFNIQMIDRMFACRTCRMQDKITMKR